jgi:hypothetical protein
MDVSLHSMKSNLAELTRQGTCHMIAAALMWSVFCVLPFFSDKTIDKPLAYVLGSLISYPLALALGAILGIQAFPRENSLASLFLLASALQLPFVSILFATYWSNPDMLPWYLGVVCSVQFLLFAWLFDSSAYLFCALGTLEVSIIIGWLAPRYAYLLTPASIVLVLLISGYFLRSTLRVHHSRSTSQSGQ